jgi:phospholipase/carboxylesterase
MPQATTYVHRFEPAPATTAGGTLLLLHGTGGNENDLLPVGRAIAPDAALLSPRGRVLENGMPRFFRRLAEGVFDHDDLVARTHELADFVAESAKRYGFDARRVVAAGFSNGANIAASMMLLRPETLAGAILLRAMVPFEPKIPPDLRGRRALGAAGKADPIVKPENSERLAALLREAGAEVTLHWSPGGHTLDRADLTAAAAWWQEG